MHEHNYTYTNKNMKTGHFDIEIESLYFLELSCKCGSIIYEQYNFEGTVTIDDLKELGYDEE